MGTRDQRRGYHLLFCSFLSLVLSPLKRTFSYIGLGFGFILLVNIAYLVFGPLQKWGLALLPHF